jgi:hypothetical protein
MWNIQRRSRERIDSVEMSVHSTILSKFERWSLFGCSRSLSDRQSFQDQFSQVWNKITGAMLEEAFVPAEPSARRIYYWRMTKTLGQIERKDINCMWKRGYDLYLSVEDSAEHAEYNILAGKFDV